MTKIKEEVHKCYMCILFHGKKKNSILLLLGTLEQHQNPINFFGYGISREKNTLKKKSLKKDQKNHTKIP